MRSLTSNLSRCQPFVEVLFRKEHYEEEAARRAMPPQKPGRSKQDYQTPREFLDAVEAAFGTIAWDLAAHADNCVLPNGHYYGPGSRFGEDALTMPWGRTMSEWQTHQPSWLNPPFGSIALWAEKCARESQAGAEILFLVPASVGANWFWDFVAPYAHVYALSPRLSFDGKHPFPKDLILAHYRPAYFVPGNSTAQGFSRWRWKEPRS